MQNLKSTQILQRSFGLLKVNWLWLSCAALLTLVLSFVAGAVFGAVLELIFGSEAVISEVLVNVMSYAVGAWTGVLWTIITMRLARGQAPKASLIFVSPKLWGRMLVFFFLMLLAVVLIAIGAVIPPMLVTLIFPGILELTGALSIVAISCAVIYGAVVAGIYWTVVYTYGLVPNLIADGHKSVTGAMENSSRLMKGIKLRLFFADLGALSGTVLLPLIPAFVCIALVVGHPMSFVVTLGWVIGVCCLLVATVAGFSAMPLNRAVLYVHLEKKGVINRSTGDDGVTEPGIA